MYSNCCSRCSSVESTIGTYNWYPEYEINMFLKIESKWQLNQITVYYWLYIEWFQVHVYRQNFYEERHILATKLKLASTYLFV